MFKELKKSGYTLLELVVVIVILVLMTAFAVPAFNSYGKNQAYNQEIEEIKTLMYQTYTLSRNPEQGIDRYELSTTGSTGGTFSLKKYTDLSDTTGSVIKEISIPTDQTIQCNTGTNICQKLTCYTDPSRKCEVDDSVLPPDSISPLNIFNTDDHIPSDGKLATFTFSGVSFLTGTVSNTPFSIKTERTGS